MQKNALMRFGGVMARGINRLSARAVETVKKPGLLADGGGLYLQVSKSGSKSWLYKFMLNGRSREMGLGSLKGVSLMDAREKAAGCRSLLAEGIDPIEDRKTRQNECKEKVYVSFVRSGERSGDKRVLTVHQGNALVIETELTQGTIHKLLRELVKLM